MTLLSLVIALLCVSLVLGGNVPCPAALEKHADTVYQGEEDNLGNYFLQLCKEMPCGDVQDCSVCLHPQTNDTTCVGGPLYLASDKDGHIALTYETVGAKGMRKSTLVSIECTEDAYPTTFHGITLSDNCTIADECYDIRGKMSCGQTIQPTLWEELFGLWIVLIVVGALMLLLPCLICVLCCFGFCRKAARNQSGPVMRVEKYTDGYQRS
eukprot:TRINITY_DN10029_c0_g1_i1.p1 TRINITY_DN10029_c0_g1~~TRINITY_DN10029_c0_g1_i1.p1  ORF type:complete len:231 (-),score=28.36 TRINITY_DN10029_c0_g1_i1:46-678(-)